jgi:hypothetical protein
VVITHERRVAAWVEGHGDVRGPLGSGVAVMPIVVLISGDDVEALLDEAQPELAFLAAWAMQRRHGRVAMDVVLRALTISRMLEGDLRERRRRGILSVLSEDMRNNLRRAAAMQQGEVSRQAELDDLLAALDAREDRAVAQGEASGQAKSVLIVLDARSVSLTKKQRARIAACTDPETLRTWLVRAVSAGSANELFR